MFKRGRRRGLNIDVRIKFVITVTWLNAGHSKTVSQEHMISQISGELSPYTIITF